MSRILTALHFLAALTIVVACEDVGEPGKPPPGTIPGGVLIDEYPSWSADGSSIMYYHYGVTEILASSQKIDPDSAGLWVVAGAGGSPRLVLNGSALRGQFAWLDDQVALVVGGHIFRSRLEADSLVEITQLTLAGGNFDPAWSRDDSTIAYRSNATGQYRVWRMLSNGEAKRQMPLAWSGIVHQVDWFPTGDRVIASAYDGTGLNYDLVVFDTSGSVVEVLAQTNQSETWPRVSPDGTRIAFERLGTIWVVESDNTGSRFVVNGRYPTWAPDGESLAYVTNEGAYGVASTVWIVRVLDGVKRQLTFGP